jgi:hypothetical protein
MDVHTPKPVHSLRELAREIGIIVIGVLIALAGEQLVVALNRAYEARATEAALRQEVGISLIYAAERVMVGPCLKGRLVGLSQALQQGGDWRAIPLSWPGAIRGIGDVRPGLPVAYAAPARGWYDNSWQAVLASGAAAHMSEARLRTYGLLYRFIDGFRTRQLREDALIPAIQPLAYDQMLSADKRAEMQADIAALDRENYWMAGLGEQFIENARRNGLPPDPARLEARFQDLGRSYGNCAQRLGSTASSVPAYIR